MGKLYICTTDHLNGFHNLISLLLQTLLQILRDGQHGGSAEAVAGMDSHGIHILDKAYGDHVVVLIADNLKLQLLPAGYGFFYENLSDQTGRQTSLANGAEFIFIIYKAAAGTAHGVGGTKNYGITELIGNGQCFVYRVGNLAAGNLDAQSVHGLFEFDTILAAFDGIYLNTDNLDIILVQYTCLRQLGAEVQSGLSAQVGKECIRPFLLDHCSQSLHIKRFDVGYIRHFGICHDRCRIGVDQNDLISKASESLAGLCAGIIELAGLTDNDRSGADNENLVNVCPFRHKFHPPRVLPISSNIPFFPDKM